MWPPCRMIRRFSPAFSLVISWELGSRTRGNTGSVDSTGHPVAEDQSLEKARLTTRHDQPYSMKTQ